MLLRATPKTVLKIAGDENLAVRLDGDGVDLAADDAEIERLVEPAVGFQPGDAIARHRRSAVRRERGESAARQNFAVRLHRDCIDIIVRVRIERIRQAGDGDRAGRCGCASVRRCCSLR